MGESIVDASNHEDKMGETSTARSNPVLDVSVSFGRFENDSLSWERWSSFSPNKYLEEVERCATPGSVAKKAAYFEAHYKKIAARKAELLDQGKQMEDDPPKSNGQTCVDLIVGNSRTQLESDISDCQSSAEVVNHETSLGNERSGILVNGPNTDLVSMIECQSSSIEGKKEEVESRLETPTLEKPEEVVNVLVEEEVQNASISMKEMQEKEIKNVSNAKLDRLKESHKITLVEKKTNITRTKKKPASPVAKASSVAKGSPLAKALPAKASPIAKTLPAKASPIAKALPEKASPITKGSPSTKTSPVVKAPQNFAPRVSKPTSSFTPVASSRSSTRIGNSSSLGRTKNPSAGESKKLASKSLHMSLSFGHPLSPSSRDPASRTITRKSLIMEKMGDKDIVKRAFKTFQNSYNQLKSAGKERSPASKQGSPKVAEPRVSTLVTPQKENGGSCKRDSVEIKHEKASPSSLAMKSDEKAEKRREFAKKLEEKSNARQVERSRLPTKSKEDEEEIQKVRQSLNSKTTSMPGIHCGQKISKGSTDKESKNEIHRNLGPVA